MAEDGSPAQPGQVRPVLAAVYVGALLVGAVGWAVGYIWIALAAFVVMVGVRVVADDG